MVGVLGIGIGLGRARVGVDSTWRMGNSNVLGNNRSSVMWRMEKLMV